MSTTEAAVAPAPLYAWSDFGPDIREVLEFIKAQPNLAHSKASLLAHFFGGPADAHEQQQLNAANCLQSKLTTARGYLRKIRRQEWTKTKLGPNETMWSMPGGSS